MKVSDKCSKYIKTHTGGPLLVWILHRTLCHDCPVSQNALSKTKKYLDPVSASLQTIITQNSLIKSALIAISSDENNMNLCICYSHPSHVVCSSLLLCVCDVWSR